MIQNKLTIIIPFANEKYEVENTLKSIRSHSDEDLEIILINDASDDGFDYKAVAKKYNVNYILNEKRIGPAASKNIGVEFCQTPYFLLLDAHMRFYDNLWYQRIVNELETDKRTLLCCQTKLLVITNGLLMASKYRATSFGACVDFYEGNHLMEPYWIFQPPSEDAKQLTISIPCVLGAGYACSKEYWQYLKGLEGLISYGNEEAYISMKVWLEGGKCKFLKDVVIGHIYRSKYPYSLNLATRIYNRLFISELLLPKEIREKRFSEMRYFCDNKLLSEALFMLYANNNKIIFLKEYYKKIFTRDFAFYEKLNKQIDIFDEIAENVDEVLDTIVHRIKEQPIPEIGILTGQMGIAIFFYHYSRYSNNEEYKELADTMLSDILKKISAEVSICFCSGLTGIGWGIEYLYQNGFIEGDTNEIMEIFDKKIMEIDPLRISNLSRNYGLGGIVLYLLARLYTIEKEGKVYPFDTLYLNEVYKKVSTIIEEKNVNTDCLDVYFKFLYYYERKQIDSASIYDVSCLLNISNQLINEINLGLNGCAGLGLKLILDQI